MKKIIPNDRYGQTAAILEGRRTMMRMIVPEKEAKRLDYFYGCDDWYYAVQTCIDDSSRFDIGEVVAVAQSYYTIKESHRNNIPVWANIIANTCDGEPGCYNRKLVKAELMPHQIRITDIKVERLQDISDEDCLKEGIFQCDKFENYKYYTFSGWKFRNGLKRCSESARMAFAHLIDKINGKSTWEINPWVFAYTFELVK